MKKYTALAFLILSMLGKLPSQAQTIGMRMPDTTVVSGNTIDFPVYAVSTVTGNNVLSYLLQLNFNQSYLQFISVITTGTISAPFGSAVVNTAVPGQITIAGAGVAALTGSGKFLYVRFKTLLPGGTSVAFTGVQNNYFNEAIPAMSFINGSINSTAPPFITVSPNTGIITTGETQQFSVSGGTAPFQWFVTNSAVASISSTGLLSGTQTGFTKVVAVDNLGLRDTTNSPIEIRPMRLSIPNNLSQWQGADIDVPVNTTSLNGLNIYSGNFILGFNQNILIPLGVVQTGTLLSSYPAPVFNWSSPGILSLDFAGSNPLSGSGTLIYVKFHVSSVNTGATYISFSNGLFNETLIPNFTDGYFSTTNLPVLSISPLTGTLAAGQTQQFTLNGGGTPPIVWSVSNPLIASISPTGLMTTIKGGNVTVTATDFHGATATSGTWLVYDTRVIMPDTTTCLAGTDFYYPVLIKALPPGESVNSVQATVTYNSSYLTFESIEPIGTLTQGWTYATNPTAGQIIFAGSGITSFNTSGTIVLLKFLLKPAFTLGSYASLQIPAITLNEGVPNPMVDVNGYINATNSNLVVSVSVSASANPVYSGASVTFTATPVNGGASPGYQWRVNGTAIPGATNPTYSYIPANNDAVTCVLTSSTPCTAAGTATSNTVTMTVLLVPANTAVTGTVSTLQNKCYSATNTITVAGGGTLFTVMSGASVTMIAGQSIDYLPGTTIYQGGYMHGYIAPAGPYCASPPVPANPTGSGEIPSTSANSFFKVYPNPTTGDFTVELDLEVVAGQVNVEIFGIEGEKVISATMAGEMKHTFSLFAKPAGLYFIRVISGNHAETRKIIRE